MRLRLTARRWLSAIALACAITVSALAQGPRQPAHTQPRPRPSSKSAKPIEKQLEDIAIIDRKVMVPMTRRHAHGRRHLPAEGHFSRKYPIIFSRTPYNLNFWDVATRHAPRTCRTRARGGEARLRSGSAMNERGPLLLRRQLRHSRRHRSRTREDQFNWMSHAALVEWQGRAYQDAHRPLSGSWRRLALGQQGV